MDSAEALRLVDTIYARLNGRRAEVQKREDYYLGKQPLSFATAEWQKANAARYIGFSDNWCRPVVDVEAERIRHTGIKISESDAAADTLWKHWRLNDMEMQSSQGFVSTLTAARSFVIVWGDADGQPIDTWEHASSVEVETDPENPRRVTAALKTWVDGDTEMATLYTDSFVWKFERDKIKPSQVQLSQAQQNRIFGKPEGGWTARQPSSDDTWPLSNPIGEVPVVEVPNRPLLAGDPISEIEGVMPMQDGINLFWAYLFVAADYASMPARVVTNQGPPKIPILDETGKKIGDRTIDLKDLAEKRLLFLAGDAKIAQWDAARLDVFTDVIDVAVGHIASQTRTPPTYLVTKTGMSNVSSDGLTASETGLTKKVLEFHEHATPAMRRIHRLNALVLGDKPLADLVRLGEMAWANPAIHSESQKADALSKKKAMGYPLEYLMEMDGMSPPEVDRVMAMRDAELLDPQLAAATRGLTDIVSPSSSE